MSLIEKLLKNSTVDTTAVLNQSTLFGPKQFCPTSVPIVNVALSARLDGGVSAGITMLAGPSKHFKTAFALLMAAAYLKAHPKGTLLFYDSEFGSPQSYFESFGIPLDQIVHTPITNVEMLRHDLATQLEGLERKDEVIVVVDSIGNLASKKEVDDAISGNSAADLTRARVLKSLFRIVTPHLTLKSIPMIVVNHTYKEIGMFPKDIVSGGTGSYYSADTIIILGRRQDKDGTELTGYNFIINIEKSRYVREKSSFPVAVSFDGGINKWSGLLEMAMESGHVASYKKGWYQRIDPTSGELIGTAWRKSDLETNEEFWTDMIANTNFPQWITKNFEIGGGPIVSRSMYDEDEMED